jgi:filamentous hemagglutinin family protein
MGGAIASSVNCAFAQITPDGTLGAESSVVTPLDPDFPIDAITGGATRGVNLFHSFVEFNVDEGRGAYFDNPTGIENILSRVTGSDPSDILGTLGVLGNANLFLINPNGIIFGPNASLDVGGLFVATTANAIRLGDTGIFSASEPATSNLLTVKPSALFFNSLTSQAIDNRSTATSTVLGFAVNGLPDRPINGLQVLDNQSLSLVGGNVSLDGGSLQAPGGRVELGGVAGVGTVGLNGDGSLSFPNGVARADVSLTNGANVDVIAGGGGSIAVKARNIDVSGGSFLSAGIGEGLGSFDSQAGDITLNVTGEITVTNGNISSTVESEAVGKGGDISIKTQSLSLTDGSRVRAITSGQGDAGNVRIDTGQLIVQDGSLMSTSTFPAAAGQGGDLTVTASESVELIGTSADGFPSSLLAQTGGAGDGGNLTIETKELSIRDGAGVSIQAFGEGQGGTVAVTASESVELIGTSSVDGLPSGLFTITSGRLTDAPAGDGGDLTIETGKLIVRDGAQVEASTTGEGQAGTVEINASESVELIGTSSGNGLASGLFTETDGVFTEAADAGDAGKLSIATGRLILQNGAQVSAATSTGGNGGDIDIKAGSLFAASDAQLNVSTSGEGRAGNINIDTRELIVRKGAEVTTDTTGNGNGGNLIVRASESVEVIGESAEGSSSVLATRTQSAGDAGNLTIETGRLVIRDGAFVSASAIPDSEGKGGNLNVTASDSVEVIGTTADGQFASGLVAETDGAGDAGNLTIDTGRLIIRDGGTVSTETSGGGKGGTLIVNAAESVDVIGGAPSALFSSGLTAETEGAGDAGDLRITTGRLLAQDGGFVAVVARTGSSGNAGNLTVTAADSVEVVGAAADGDFVSGLDASVESGAEGDGGDLTIKTQRLSVRDGAIVSVNNSGKGDAGTLQIDATGVQLDNQGKLTAETASGQGGNIRLQAQDLLLLRRNSQISTTAGTAQAGGDGGNINIDTDFIVTFPSEDSNITANAFRGNGGRVDITTQGIFGISLRDHPTELSDITASSEFGVSGTVNINTLDVDPSQGLVALPTDLVDASGLIAQNCPADGGATASELSEFIVTGRGGLPPSPSDALSSQAVWQDLRPPARQVENRSSAAPSTNPTRESAPTQIVEANGWVINGKGEVVLTASTSTATLDIPWVPNSDCHVPEPAS